MLDCNADEEAVEILTAFVKQYIGCFIYPERDFASDGIKDQELIEQWLSELNRLAYIRRPQRELKELVEMVNHNAEVVLEEAGS